MGRNTYFDSLKFVLIALVVFGHVIEQQAFNTLYSGDSDHLTLTVYGFLYSFHMPLFVFISGYFSQNMTWEKFLKSFKALIPTYILFQIILSIPDILNDSFKIIRFIAEPKGVMWYILSLLSWRFLFSFIPKNKNVFPIVLSISILAALICGFVHFPINLFSIPKTIGFMPFFVLGYYCNQSIIDKIRALKPIYSIAILITAFVGIYFFATGEFISSFFLNIYYEWLFGDRYFLGLIIRILIYPMSTILAVCIMNITVDRFAKWGSKTLEIYLLHAVLIFCIYHQLISYYDWHTNLLINSLVFILVMAICLWASNLKAVQYLVNPTLIFSKKEQVK